MISAPFNRTFLLEHAPQFIGRVHERNVAKTSGELSSSELESEDLLIGEFSRAIHSIVSAVDEDIQNRVYRPASARLRMVEVDKSRTLVKFSLVDEFVLSAAGAWVQSSINSILTSAVFGFRKGHSDRAALQQVSEFVQLGDPIWVVRRDVSDFGESLDHNRILQIVKKHFWHSAPIRYTIEQFLRYRIIVEGFALNSSKTSSHEAWNFRGLPTGSNLQLQLANLYLHELDSQIEQSAQNSNGNQLYIRLGDDILFMSRDRHVARINAERIDQFLSDVKLKLNTSKSFDFCLCKPHSVGRADEKSTGLSVFRFLGMDVFWNGEIRLPADKWQSVLGTIRQTLINTEVIADRRRRFATSVEALTRLLHDQDGNPRFQAYLRKITSVSQLRELDRWIALLMGKTHFLRKFSKKNFKITSQRKLRRLGVPSCVHLARTRGIIQ